MTDLAYASVDLNVFMNNINKKLDGGLIDNFGLHESLSREQIEHVKAAIANRTFSTARHYYDLDHDGDPDELIYFETGKNRGGKWMLIKVIDNDDGMHILTYGDTDPDTWLVDYHVDGTIDRVNDYGFDKINDLFYQYIYYSGFAHASPGAIIANTNKPASYFLHVTDFEYY